MPYRDAVTRVSIAQLRAQFKPRAFRALATVRIDVGGAVMEAKLVDDVGVGFVKGTRRWFECPRCQRRVNVLGIVEGVGWVCPPSHRTLTASRSEDLDPVPVPNVARAEA